MFVGKNFRHFLPTKFLPIRYPNFARSSLSNVLKHSEPLHRKDNCCPNGKYFPNGKVENFLKWLEFPNQEVNQFPDRESGLCTLRKWPSKVKKLMSVVKEGE